MLFINFLSKPRNIKPKVVVAKAEDMTYPYDGELTRAVYNYLAETKRLTANWDVFNTANGKDFYDHSLRSKGLKIAGSKAHLHKYDRKYLTCGVFADISYDWKGFVGADLAFRTDYTPEYGNWKLYPSGSAYWDIRRACS